MLPDGHYLWEVVSVDGRSGDPWLDYRLQAAQAGEDVSQRLPQQPQDRQVCERFFLRFARDTRWFLDVFCGQVLQIDHARLVLSPELIQETIGRQLISQYVRVPLDGRMVGRMPRGSFRAVGG